MAAGLNTASPPVLTPGGNHFNKEVWRKTVAPATYQDQIFIPRCEDMERPYSKGHARKYARMSSVALGSSAVGHTNLTYQDPLATEVTLTPAGVYVATAWSENEGAMTDVPFDSDLARESEQAIAEGNDLTAMLNVATLTQFRGNGVADVDAALIRGAMGLLTTNTNGKVVPGETTVYCLLDTSQYSALMSIPEYTSAQLRGDSENPNVKGMWRNGGGVTVSLTTVCPTDANGTHGVMWIPEAFLIGWNVKTKVMNQGFELQNRVILYNNFGSTVMHDLRAVSLRTGNTLP
jgi:hypothetical protein